MPSPAAHRVPGTHRPCPTDSPVSPYAAHFRTQRSLACDGGARAPRGSSGTSAVNLVVGSGQKRLQDSLSVLFFPEGTRMAPGETRKYGVSGVLLATRAGFYWQRRGLLKKPGTILVVVAGKPIDATGRDGREINAEVQAWIEGEIAGIRAAKAAASIP